MQPSPTSKQHALLKLCLEHNDLEHNATMHDFLNHVFAKKNSCSLNSNPNTHSDPYS